MKSGLNEWYKNKKRGLGFVFYYYLVRFLFRKQRFSYTFISIKFLNDQKINNDNLLLSWVLMQDQGVNVQKKNIGIIFGGKSTEHEVSLQSARNIVDAIDREKFDITLIGIDKNGIWHLDESTHFY